MQRERAFDGGAKRARACSDAGRLRAAETDFRVFGHLEHLVLHGALDLPPVRRLDVVGTVSPAALMASSIEAVPD